MIFRRWFEPVIRNHLSNRISYYFSHSHRIKSVHHQILLCGGFFLIGSLCPIIFYHTHFAKDYQFKNYCGKLQIYLNGQRIVVKALLDTGNRLYEPLTGKPVCLVEYGRLKACLRSRSKLPKLRAIPYHSVGEKHGVLLGITADKLIFKNHRQKYEQSGCIIGIYPGNLSESGGFHAIVHPDILKK